MPTIRTRLSTEQYEENGFMVFTERAHIERGACCGSDCRHCPFEPRAQRGNRKISPYINALLSH